MGIVCGIYVSILAKERASGAQREELQTLLQL